MYEDKTTGKRYYNLTHGTKGPGTWRWYAGTDPVKFPSDTPELVLSDSNYLLLPVYKNGNIVKDMRDNICYNIGVDNDPSHSGDILLLWSIPGRTYIDVEFSISGSAELLGKGSVGRSRGDASITWPSPVVEIYGDCELVWVGKTKDNKDVTQIVKYTYASKEWDIGVIAVAEG